MNKSPWLRTFLIVLCVAVVCAVIAALFQSRVSGHVKKLDATLTERKNAYNANDELMQARPTYEGNLEAYASLLKRYDLPVADPDVVPSELIALGLRTVPSKDIEAKMIRDLSKLAEQSGCELVEYKPAKYEQRRVEPDPRKAAANKTDEEKKKAEDNWKKLTPEKKAKIEKDQLYAKKLADTRTFAEVEELQLRVRGKLDDIQRFICGLSRWPTAENFVFPHLVMVENVRIRAISSSSNPTPPGANPDLDADLSARVFSLKELDFSEKEKPAAGASGGAGGSSRTQPDAGTAARGKTTQEREPSRT